MKKFIRNHWGKIILVALFGLWISGFRTEWSGMSKDEIDYSSEPARIQVTNDFEHAMSGIVLNSKVGDYSLLSVTEYDTDGFDVSGAYELTDPYFPASITVYVYPADRVGNTKSSPDKTVEHMKLQVMRNHFSNVLSGIRQGQRNPELIEEKEVEVNQNGQTYKGLFAKFEIDDDNSFTRGGRATSLAYIYRYEDWYVKYRITYTHDFQEKVEPKIDRFLSEFHWFDSAENTK